MIMDIDKDSIPRPLGNQYFPITDVRKSYNKCDLLDEDLSILKTYRQNKHPDAPQTLAWNPYPAFGKSWVQLHLQLLVSLLFATQLCSNS